MFTAFGMIDSRPVQTLLDSHFRLLCSQCPTTNEERHEMVKIPYRNVVRCLMYAIVLTRPNITHVVSVVSRYITSLGKEHWRVIRWIMRYLNGTLSYGLVYSKDKVKNDDL